MNYVTPGVYGRSLNRDLHRAGTINEDLHCYLFEIYMGAVAECDEELKEELARGMIRQQEIGERIAWSFKANNGNGGNA